MGYVKTYRNSVNLFDKTNADIYNTTTIVPADNQWIKYTGTGKTIRIPVRAKTKYGISIGSSIVTTVFRVILIDSENVPDTDSPVYGTIVVTSSADNTAIFTTGTSTKYIVFQVSAGIFTDAIDSLMLCYDVARPYEAYNTTAWYDFCKKKTATGWADSTAQKAPF